MTSTTGADEHPEVAEISALTEGILPPDRSADIRDHLDDCTLCADVRASLEEIRGLLGTLPGPARMPDDIAGRIDAALAAEALLDSTVPDAPPPVSRETSTADDVSRETAPLTEHAPERPAGHGPAATGPGRSPRRRRWRSAMVAAGCTVGAIALGGILVQSLGTGGNSPAPNSAERSPAAAPDAGTWAGESLQTRVRELVAGERSAAPELGAESTGGPTAFGTATNVPSCVLAGIGRSEHPLASDPGVYQGTDSYLVVLPHTSDPTLVDAYVVNASCVTDDPAAPGKILHEDTYVR